jgi:uncharacterized Zn-finger protein
MTNDPTKGSAVTMPFKGGHVHLDLAASDFACPACGTLHPEEKVYGRLIGKGLAVRCTGCGVRYCGTYSYTGDAVTWPEDLAAR